MTGRWPRAWAVLAGVLALVATLVGLSSAGGPGKTGAGAGDPAHGELLWQSNRCGACHSLKRAGSSGTTAPNIDRWLVPHAIRAHMPLERFALSRVYWGGRGMPAYGRDLSGQELDDVVSFVLGRPFTAPTESVSPVSGFDPPPALVTVSSRVVAGWVKAKRLKATAARGAALFAGIGCLSCHTYLGSGKRRLGARDLTRIGRAGRSARGFRTYVARPYASGNTLMPSYADLADAQLGQLASFLAASR